MTDGPTRGAWVVWGIGVSAYAVGAFHRSSLAVAGLRASERFDISATQLGSFVVLQLAVYAIAQVPVGVLVDRYGPRRVLVGGTVAMGVGQLAFAFADTYALALLARVLVGLGDATAFVCVLRLVMAWFPARRIPLVIQLTGPIGQVGTIAAALPMAWALSRLGWEGAYTVAAVLGLAVGLAVWAFVRDEPGSRSAGGAASSWTAVAAGLRQSWASPGTRLGFWIHFSQHFSATSLGLVWGYPWFVRGHGVSPAEAGLLLTTLVVAVIGAAPAVGWLVASRPDLRIACVLVSLGLVAGAWTVVLAWPGVVPVWVLAVLVVTVGACGPVAMIGFDVARTASPPERLASVTGLVNQGGFVSSLAVILLIGLLLDLTSATSASGPAPRAFAVALACQYAFWLLAAVQVWRLRVAVR